MGQPSKLPLKICITESKEKRFIAIPIICYDEKGNPKTKSVTAKTKYECEENLRALKDELGKAVEKMKPDMPFGEWMDFWYQNFCRPALRETTRVGYENYIYRHIIPSVGHIPLNKLSQNDLQQFYDNLKKNCRLQYADTIGSEVSSKSMTTCGKEASIRECPTARERSLTYMPKQEKNARKPSQR